MGAGTFKIPTEFSAVDKFTSVISKMVSGVSNFTKSTAAAVGRVNKKIDGMFSSLNNFSQLALGLGAAGLFTMAIGGVMDYETALHSLSAVTGESFSKYEDQIESLADKNKKSAIDVAGGFETIGSAMSQYLGDPKALEAITQAGITLAKASRQELTPTLENLTSVMNQFKLGAEDADKVINQLTAGEIVGSVSTAQVAEGLQEFGANAYNANVKLSESVALIETLGKQMDKSKIAVGARNILGVLDSAKGLPKEATESLKKHGVSTKILMDKTLPLGVRLKELSKIQKDAVAVTKVFGKENKTAANVIFQNLDSYNAWEAQIKTTNKAQEQAAINSDTLGTKIKELKDSFINAIITTDESNVSLAYMKDVLGWVGDNMNTVVGVIAALVLGYAGLKAIMLITSIWTFVSAVAMGVMGAATGVASIAIGQSAVAMAAYNVVSAIMTAVTWLANSAFITLAISILAATWPIMAIIAAVLGIVYIFLYWDEICAWFGQQWEKFTAWIGEKWDQLTSWFSNFSFKDLFMGIGQAIINYMLFPLRAVLWLVSKLPGKLGALGKAGYEKFDAMTTLGGTTPADKAANVAAGAAGKDGAKGAVVVKVEDPKKIDSPEQTQTKNARDNRVKGSVDVRIRDKGGNVEGAGASSDSTIPVKVSTTQGAY